MLARNFETGSGGVQGNGREQTSLSLLHRVRERDQAAWERLVDVYGPLVFGWCRRTGLAEHDARDVGQEVFADVARRITAFRRDRPGDSFRAWLRTITRFKVADLHRRRREQADGGSEHQRRMADVADDEPWSTTEQEELTETEGICRRVLAHLRTQFSDQHWRAFWRTAVDGQSAAFVADELAMTEANVRQVKSRVTRRLRDELAEMEELGGLTGEEPS